eukprot:2070830-Rhodomonas_salina.1
MSLLDTASRNTKHNRRTDSTSRIQTQAQTLFLFRVYQACVRAAPLAPGRSMPLVSVPHAA